MPQPSADTSLVIVMADPKHRVLDAALAAGHPADVVGVHFVEAGNGKPGLAELVLPDVTAAGTAAKAARPAAVDHHHPGGRHDAGSHARDDAVVRQPGTDPWTTCHHRN